MLNVSPKLLRTRRHPPAKFSPERFGVRPSGICPKCKTYVRNGDSAVVCVKCDAYLHFECANVSQETIEQEWKDIDFLCDEHRTTGHLHCSKILPEQSTTTDTTTDISTPTSKDESKSNLKTGGTANILRIAPFTLNCSSLLKKKIKLIDHVHEIEAKDMGKQYTISLSTVTYHIIMNNIVSIGKSIGLQALKPIDVDNNGRELKIQFESKLKVGETLSAAITISCYHTANNVLVQLKGKKNEIGWDEKLTAVNQFVQTTLKAIIIWVEKAEEYKIIKENIREGLISLQQAEKGNTNNQIDEKDLLSLSNTSIEIKMPDVHSIQFLSNGISAIEEHVGDHLQLDGDSRNMNNIMPNATDKLIGRCCQ